MKKNRTLILLVLAFALLMGGAYMLYDKLSQEVSSDQLAVQTPSVPATAPDETEAPKVQVPDFTVYDAEGTEVHLSDYFGKPIVLNFWASWCGPCQMEMPDFHEKYLELGDDIQFLMINVTDGNRETVEIAASFIAEKGYAFPVFYDTALDASNTYGAYSLPTTFFIDADGYAVARATGAIDGDTLQRGIDMITQ